LIKEDIGYTTAVFERSDDIFFTFGREIIHDDSNRKQWPDVRQSPHECFRIADDLQAQMLGRCKDDMSPSSTYIHWCFLLSSTEVLT
jgi:hypothetical protein